MHQPQSVISIPIITTITITTTIMITLILTITITHHQPGIPTLKVGYIEDCKGVIKGDTVDYSSNSAGFLQPPLRMKP